MNATSTDLLTILFCGDVMTGRGIDQVLPFPGSPAIHEPYLKDARDYVALAERVNGAIPAPVDFAYVWGDALQEMICADTDVRIVNLETSITSSEEAWPGKNIHYRMHPRNIDCLLSAGIDCCCLANNHVLDWGHTGLDETLRSIDAVGIARSGAGRTEAEAAAPAVINLPASGRVLVFSLGLTGSGIPRQWAATRTRQGINVLENLTRETARRTADQIRATTLPGDVVVASIHWGLNWGYEIPIEQIRFAHDLIDAGVDIVHGHSSHHLKAIEIYRDRPILYGCGDFIDDYEGITDHDEFRDDLRALFSVQCDRRTGRLVRLKIVPLQARRFRLNRATPADATWLCDLVNRLGSPFGTRALLESDQSIIISW